MNLVLDVGNSYTKVSLFRENGIIHLSLLKNTEYVNLIEEIKKAVKEFPTTKKVILSSVSSEHIGLDSFLSEEFEFFVKLDHLTKIPIKNLYKTPETLGKDRLAAVIAANNIFPKTNVLVFDAGTALTVDFINKENEYTGGSISPGIIMRYKALHHFTKKLPELTINSNFDEIFGSTTNDAIISGVQNGIINEVEGFINKYSEKYPDIKIIFTGGDTFFFDKRLNNKIIADPNIVLKGLNIILEYNAK